MRLFKSKKTREKEKVEKVVEQNYWNGFFAHLSGKDEVDSLEYTSTSGYYHLNEVRSIAYTAGWRYAKAILELHDQGLDYTLSRRIPGKVYAECYGAARIAAA